MDKSTKKQALEDFIRATEAESAAKCVRCNARLTVEEVMVIAICTACLDNMADDLLDPHKDG